MYMCVLNYILHRMIVFTDTVSEGTYYNRLKQVTAI